MYAEHEWRRDVYRVGSLIKIVGANRKNRVYQILMIAADKKFVMTTQVILCDVSKLDEQDTNTLWYGAHEINRFLDNKEAWILSY